MRFVFALLFVAGLALAAAGPLADRFFARDVGTWRLYDAAGARTAQIAATGEGPLDALVDVTLEGAPGSDPVGTLTLTQGGSPVLTVPLVPGSQAGRDAGGGTRVYRISAGKVDASGGPLTAEVVAAAGATNLRAASLVLRTPSPAVDPRLQPAGFAVTAIGFVGLVLAVTRRRPQPSEAPSQRWGRGAGPVPPPPPPEA